MTASSRIFGIVIDKEKTDAFVPVAGNNNSPNWIQEIRYVKS